MRSAIALIPARAGSQRVPSKNVRRLGRHPLLAYSIAAAQECGLFDAVIVSTDCEAIAAVARHYGAEVPGLRPSALATATAPDIGWVRHTLDALAVDGRRFELFSILRPTSPFRTAATIRRAWKQLLDQSEHGADSLRAVELCRQHPGKMWVIDGERMRPLLRMPQGELPWHSRQYQDLPPVYVQNSSLEIAWTRVVVDKEIAGRLVVPFLTEGTEGFTIDYPDDWERAERLLASSAVPIPHVPSPPFPMLVEAA